MVMHSKPLISCSTSKSSTNKLYSPPSDTKSLLFIKRNIEWMGLNTKVGCFINFIEKIKVHI